MIYAGNAIQVQMHDHQLAKLTFDLKNQSVNKLNAATLVELKEAIEAINNAIIGVEGVKGLMLTSAKSSFIVGADITEFLQFLVVTSRT